MRYEVLYDSKCDLCVATRQLIEKVDREHLFLFKSMYDQGNAVNEILIKKMNTGKGSSGFRALLRMTESLPPLYFFIPLMFLLDLTGTGKAIYREIARRRNSLPFLGRLISTLLL